MRSRSSILELIVQFLFPFQCFRLKRNVDNNNINQSLLPWRLWNKTLFMGLPPDCTFEGSKIVSRYLSQNKSLLWPSFSICFEIQAVQCTAGLPRSPESVEKEIKLHCKVTNIRSTRTSLQRIQLTLSGICSTYRATSTQHTENLFIFRLLKTWRWLVNALRPRSWHDFEDIYIRQKLNSCCSGTSVRKQAWFQNTVFSSGITSRRSTETRHSHPQISPNPTYNPGEGTPTYNGQECSL